MCLDVISCLNSRPSINHTHLRPRIRPGLFERRQIRRQTATLTPINDDHITANWNRNQVSNRPEPRRRAEHREASSQITEKRCSKGLWEGQGKQNQTGAEQNYSVDHPLSMLRRRPIKAARHLSEMLSGRREEKADWCFRCPPSSPPLSPCMYLGAAKPCVILMSSAFCNLTWEFKSCLSFASHMSAGFYFFHKEEKKAEKLVGLQLRADVRCTSLPVINWNDSAFAGGKKRSFGRALGISQQYFLHMKW